MKWITLMLFIIAIFVLSANSTYACSCRMPDVREAFDIASAVFTGEVIDIVESRQIEKKAALKLVLNERLYTIKFKVEKSFKGVSAQEEVAVTRSDSKSCFGYPEVFVGEKYLVYAYLGYKDGVYAKGTFSISSCGGRTGILSEAGRTPFRGNMKDWQGRRYAIEDLKKLEEIINPPYRLQLNLKSNGAPNNSFNRSGNSLFFIRELEGSIQYFPPG